MRVNYELSKELAELIKSVPGECEDNAVLASEILKKRRIVHHICIGVAQVGGKFVADHAWLELNSGEIVDPSYAIQDWFLSEKIVYVAKYYFSPRHMKKYWSKDHPRPKR